MITLNLDLSPLREMQDQFQETFRAAAKKAASELAGSVHGHILEQAQQKLKSRRQQFIDGLSYKKDGDTYLIVLDKSAVWIDDGLQPHSMIDDLLSQRNKGSKPPKTAKDGSSYRVIPFKHGPGKGETSMTPAESTLQATVKSELRRADNQLTGKRGIPYGKIEKDAQGQPLTGLLHSIKMDTPPKTANGPGQGWGRVGDPRQGATGIPFLQGIKVYQQSVKGQGGKTSTKRAIMTFRTVSSKMKGSGRWFHPGSEGMFLLDEAYEWGLREWEHKILPGIVDMIINS